MSVLVDTSVWIRFLSNRAPYAGELDRLLGRDEVHGHELVYGELLIGDKGGRKALLADYERMEQAPVVPYAEVVAFVRGRMLHGRGIGWIDAHLLASALVGRLRLWTVDPALETLGRALGIAYEQVAHPEVQGVSERPRPRGSAAAARGRLSSGPSRAAASGPAPAR